MRVPGRSSCSSSASPARGPLSRAYSGGEHRILALGALTVLLLQEALADADTYRGDFHQLVVGDELDRILQRQRNRRRQQDGIILAGGPDVGELLGLDGVHHQIVVAAVDADDHALVELLAGAHEESAPLLQVEQRIGDRFALLVADQHAVVAVGDVALHRRESVEDMAHQAGAAGERHELTLEADQAARRDAIVEAHAPVTVDGHVGQFRAARTQRFHDRALVRVLHVYGECLVRLVHVAVHDARQNLRTRDGELIAFAALVLDEDGEVQLAAAGYAEHVRLLRIFDAQRHIALQLAIEALANLPAGDELAFPSGEGRGIDLEIHGERRLIDADGREPLGGLRVADREADVHPFDARYRDDVAGARL